MEIAAKKAVTIEYTLKDPAGKLLDSSEGREPLTYLHGASNIVAGLERALGGKSVGDSLEVTLTPEEGYGMRDESLIRNIPLRRLPPGKVEPGMRFQAQTERGPAVLTVLGVKGDYAKVDPNHPLAGTTLCFSVKVIAVRDATEEELAHGHAHGADGQAHQH